MNLTDAIGKLKEGGLRMTPQRRAILHALHESENPLNPKEIYDRVSIRFPDLSPDTVYRNVRWLTEHGILDEISLPGQEASRYEWMREHHHHRVCLQCGEVVCLPACTINPATDGADDAFYVVRHIYEEYGYCQECLPEFGRSRQDVPVP